MIRKTVLVLAAGAAIAAAAAAAASTHSSAHSYGHNVGAGGYTSSFDFHKPAYSFGYRISFAH